MKVVRAPAEVPVPEFDFTKMDWPAYQKLEEDYLKSLKEHLIKLGYNGPNTGAEFSIPWADGAARYMVAEPVTGPLALVHLPLGDAWDVPEYMTRGLRKNEVLRQIEIRAANRRLKT